MNSLLSVRDLHVTFDISQGGWPWTPAKKLRAVNGISFDLKAGQTLGIVGESGCGKSTLIRAIAGLTPMSQGRVHVDGVEMDYANPAQKSALVRSLQMIFQDPIASLNPRMTVIEIVQEPLQFIFPEMSAQERRKKAYAMLDRVGISQRNFGRYPHEFSGGQCQRIGIARALISAPKILLCDEPVSALDVSIQAQVVNLLLELQAEMGLAMIFVAHDLGIVHHISDDILVMYLGGMMEGARARDLVDAPRHPYTQALLSAIPVPNPHKRIAPQTLDGELPSPMDLPNGCLFATRCPKVQDRCLVDRPDFANEFAPNVACHFPR